MQSFASKKDSLLGVVKNSKINSEKVDAYINLSTIEREHNAQKSIDYALSAINLSKSIKDKSYQIKSYIKLGQSYRKYDSLEKALKYFLLGLELSEKTDNKRLKSGCLNNLGSIYLQYDQNDEALDYYLKAYEISKDLNDSLRLCNVLNNIGIIYWRNKQIDSSIKYMHESLVLSIELKDSIGLISSYNNLGMLHSEQHNFDRAIGYYNQALMIAKNFEDNWEIANVLNNRANLKIESEQYEGVLEDLQTSIDISDKINSKLLKSDSYLTLSGYYVAIKDFENALESYKKYSDLNMQLVNSETSNKIADIQKDYELKTKDNNLEKLSIANNIQYYLILLLATTLSLLGIFVFIYFRKYNENKSISSELSNRNNELEKLSDSKSKFFTLISHDLKAPLYNISNLSNMMKLYRFDMEENEKDETLNQLNISSKHLITLVDNILLWARTQTGSIENNPKDLWVNSVINECIVILKPIANEKKIELINNETDLEVKADYNLLSTSIRNLISNAIKFSNPNSIVLIKAISNNNFLEISVVDEGVGIEKEKLEQILKGNYSSELGTNNEKGSGLGLKITKEFIEINGGILTGESKPNEGSTFTIKLPKK